MTKKHKSQMSAQAAIGANVYERRLSAGMSQQQLADSIGMHRSFFSEIERGRSNVTLSSLMALAHALNCGVHDLLRGVE